MKSVVRGKKKPPKLLDRANEKYARNGSSPVERTLRNPFFLLIARTQMTPKSSESQKCLNRNREFMLRGNGARLSQVIKSDYKRDVLSLECVRRRNSNYRGELNLILHVLPSLIYRRTIDFYRISTY